MAPGAIDAKCSPAASSACSSTGSTPVRRCWWRPSAQLEIGDKIIIMGTPEAMREMEVIVHPGGARGRRRVTIIGGGDVGLQAAERLEKTDGFDVRIMERDAARGAALAARLTRTLVINGDGTDLEFQESEDVTWVAATCWCA